MFVLLLFLSDAVKCFSYAFLASGLVVSVVLLGACFLEWIFLPQFSVVLGSSCMLFPSFKVS